MRKHRERVAKTKFLSRLVNKDKPAVPEGGKNFQLTVSDTASVQGLSSVASNKVESSKNSKNKA